MFIIVFHIDILSRCGYTTDTPFRGRDVGSHTTDGKSAERVHSRGGEETDRTAGVESF